MTAPVATSLSKRQGRALLTLVGSLLAIAVIVRSPVAVFGSTPGRAEYVTAVVAIGSLFAASALSTRRWRSPLVIYLAVFSVFHAAIAVVHVFRLPFPDRRAKQLLIWFDASSYVTVQALVCLAILALIVGASVAALPRQSRLSLFGQSSELDRKALGVAGGLFLLAGVAAWITIVVGTMGARGFFRNYDEYIRATRSTPVGWSQVLVGLGLAFTAAGTPSLLRRMGLLAFAVFVLLGLPLGLRGEILFPLAASAGVMARTAHRRMRLRHIALGLVVVLPLMTLVGFTRNARVRGVAPGVGALLSPTDALVEMGTTVRVPVEGIRLYKGSHQFESGQVLRDSARFFANNVGLAGSPENRIGPTINAVARGTSGIGSSPVAEFYLSGGRGLLAAYFLLLGIALMTLERLRENPWHDAVLGVFLVPLMVSVRNEFVFLPLHWAFGGAVVVVMYANRHALSALVSGVPTRRTAGVTNARRAATRG